MFNKPFVVLDLETSGTDPKKNDIIEVAMIRYENGKEVKRYDALIKINYALPKIITIITNITDKDLQAEGQDKGLVFEEIEEMLDGAYMIAHNIKFDAGFLKANGLKLDVLGFIDTIPLAQVMIPDAASYSLESLADDLKIKHVNKHRAMSDVEATLELFKYICGKIEKLPSRTIQEINKYMDFSSWDGGVVFDVGDAHVRPVKTITTPPSTIDPQSTHNRPTIDIDPKQILKEGGILQQCLPDYEYRHQQEKMADAVMSAFDEGYHLICEAPTGVGKSMAYLTAAANIAIKNKSKVVISTNTINLQEQLYEKDVPILQQVYQSHYSTHNGHTTDTQSGALRVALLKGRRHYLCLSRLAQFKNRSSFSDEEITLLTKIFVWQAVSKTGDSGEIHLTRGEKLIWDFELCSDSKYCSPQKCKPYGECYLHTARKKAEGADIIIVNHALLCADLESEGGLLPEYKYLIIDEAHNFEGASTNAFGMRLKQENFNLPLKVIKRHLSVIKKNYQGTLFAGELAMDRIEGVLDAIPDLENIVENIFTIIAYFVNQNTSDTGYTENLLIDHVILGMGEWLNLETSVDDMSTKLIIWIKEIKKFLSAFELNSNGESSEQEEISSEIMQETEILQEQISAIKNFFAEDHQTNDESQMLNDNQKSEIPRQGGAGRNQKSSASEYIRWMASDHQGAVTINLAPYVPGDLLKERLYDQKKSIILTSATLGVQLNVRDADLRPQPFTYLRTILSLDEKFEELIIDSPFDYESQAYVMVPNDAVPIASPRSTEQLAPFFASLIKKVKGSMMTLFTSYKMIETLYLDLVEPLRNEGVKLLAQRISGGRNKIMKAYLNDPANSILFGTASFWEGVDIKGSALSTLVIHKLPFDVPSDPIVKARSQMFNNGFFEYMLPRAILKLRQGFGRLIRSKKDYGVMIILDNRVLTKDYGKLFLDALPENITLEKTPLADIPGQVEEWLGLSKKD